MKIIITGGGGDWAKSFKSNFSSQYNIVTPARSALDITDPEKVSHYFKTTPCDVLINNAGAIHPKRLLASDTERWINDINVNLIGTYLTTKAVLAQNPNAIIINISSTAAYNAYPDWSSYCASKAGVVTTSQCFANDGFAVYCLCPGAIDTKFRDNLKSFVEKITLNHVPLKVTRRSGEDFVVISADDWEREQETLYVLQNNSLMEQIAASASTHATRGGYKPTKEQLDEITSL